MYTVRRKLHENSVFCTLGATQVAAGEYEFPRRWLKVADEHRRARASGLAMAIIFGNAQYQDEAGRLYGWAALDSVEVDQSGTRIRFSGVRDLEGHQSSELIKECDGQPLTYIVRRGYTVVKTPAFLRGESSRLVPDPTTHELPDLDELPAELLMLGGMTSAVARDEERAADIAHVTGLSETVVRRKLKSAHGKTLVRNLFSEYWPSGNRGEEIEKDDLGALREMTLAAARAGGREAEIASVTGLSRATVLRRLREAHGKRLVRNVFAEHWPTIGCANDCPRPRRKNHERQRGMGFQGRPEHQQLQKNLSDLGRLSRHHVRTNHSIGAGFKPDVLWYRLDPSRTKAGPVMAFEIEFGSAQAIAKSLASLKHAFDLGAHRLFLILPSGRVEGAKLRLKGAFHEIANAISVLPIERALRLSPVDLAKELGIEHL